MPLDVCPIMRTEAVSLTEATHLQVKDEDATDSTAITTQAYVEKYSVTITPTAWMKSYGKRATLIVEYIIKTDPAAGTVSVKTLVGGADAVEKTGLTIASGKQTAVHTDIADFSSDLTVSLEAKNSDAAQTSVLDYCNIYLQIGTKSVGDVVIAVLAGIQSIAFRMQRMDHKVWSGAVDNAGLYLVADLGSSGNQFHSQTAGSDITMSEYTINREIVLDDQITLIGKTANADNPMVLEVWQYRRSWFE